MAAERAPRRSEEHWRLRKGGGNPFSLKLPRDLNDRLGDDRRFVRPTKSGLSLIRVDKNSPDRHTAGGAPPDPNRFTVDVHGGPDGVYLGDTPLSAGDLARIIRSSPEYEAGEPIRLLSCRTGADTEDGSPNFARQLARELGVEVLAPSTDAWVDSYGNMYAAKSRASFERDSSGAPRPHWDEPGQWVSFAPDGATATHDDPLPPGHEPVWEREGVITTATRRGLFDELRRALSGSPRAETGFGAGPGDLWSGQHAPPPQHTGRQQGVPPQGGRQAGAPQGPPTAPQVPMSPSSPPQGAPPQAPMPPGPAGRPTSPHGGPAAPQRAAYLPPDHGNPGMPGQPVPPRAGGSVPGGGQPPPPSTPPRHRAQPPGPQAPTMPPAGRPPVAPPPPGGPGPAGGQATFTSRQGPTRGGPQQQHGQQPMGPPPAPHNPRPQQPQRPQPPARPQQPPRGQRPATPQQAQPPRHGQQPAQPQQSGPPQQLRQGQSSHSQQPAARTQQAQPPQSEQPPAPTRQPTRPPQAAPTPQPVRPPQPTEQHDHGQQQPFAPAENQYTPGPQGAVPQDVGGHSASDDAPAPEQSTRTEGSDQPASEELPAAADDSESADEEVVGSSAASPDLEADDSQTQQSPPEGESSSSTNPLLGHDQGDGEGHGGKTEESGGPGSGSVEAGQESEDRHVNDPDGPRGSETRDILGTKFSSGDEPYFPPDYFANPDFRATEADVAGMKCEYPEISWREDLKGFADIFERSPLLKSIGFDQSMSVRGYTASHCFAEINRGLREGDSDGLRKYDGHIRCLTSALNQMPPVELSRGERFHRIMVNGDMEAIAAQYSEGEVTTEHAFTSVSRGKPIAKVKPGGTRVFMEIEGYSFRDVSFMAKNPSENEAVAPPGIGLLCTEKRYDEKLDCWFLKFREVDVPRNEDGSSRDKPRVLPPSGDKKSIEEKLNGGGG